MVAKFGMLKNPFRPQTRQRRTIPGLTRRQLILGLLANGMISSQEAIDAAQNGMPPKFIADFFNALPEPDKTAAYVTWASMSVCLRTDPLVQAIGATKGLTDAQLDDYFRAASQL